MHALSRLLLIIFIAFARSAFSQGIMADSTHGFSQLISDVYNARNINDIKKYNTLIHPYYANKAVVAGHDDAEAIRWGFSISAFPKVRVHDTVTVNDRQYCKVEYTLNCSRGLSEDQMDLLPHLERLFGPSSKLGQDGYFDRSTQHL